MAEKARDAFRTISEVANWLDIPAHVLRFWESKFSQIKPVKRAGGRRYYRPADMQFIGGIKTLLHDNGMTIRGVQKMIKEDGVKKIAEMSPPLDMPSEEEGAARRAARRARRQARQAAKSDPVVEARAVETETIETGTAEPEALEAETVETATAKPAAAEAETREAEVASQDAAVAESIAEAEAETAAAEKTGAPQETETFAEPSFEEELPLAPEPPVETFAGTEPAQAELAEDSAPLILERPEEQETAEEAPFEHVEEVAAEPDNVVPIVANDDVPNAEELPLGDGAQVAAVETQTELAVEEPIEPNTAAPTVNAAQINIPDDPDPSTITLTETQGMQVARLKSIRRIDVSTELMGGSDAAVASGLTRLRALRDRVAASLDGS